MGQIRYKHEEETMGKAYDSRIVRRLAGFLAPYRSRVWQVVGYVVLATLADLALPWLFSRAIDEVATERRLWMVNVIGVAFVLAVLVRFIGQWLQYRTAQWLGNRIVFDIRNRMFRHLQSLSIGYI